MHSKYKNRSYGPTNIAIRCGKSINHEIETVSESHQSIYSQRTNQRTT